MRPTSGCSRGRPPEWASAAQIGREGGRHRQHQQVARLERRARPAAVRRQVVVVVISVSVDGSATPAADARARCRAISIADARSGSRVRREPRPPRCRMSKYRIACAHRGSDVRLNLDADRRIDTSSAIVSARRRAQSRRDRPLGVQVRDDTVAARHDGRRIRRGGQPGVVVDDTRIAALVLDDLAELLDTRARRDGTLDRGCRADASIGCDAGQHQHAGGEQHRQIRRDPRARCP